MFLHWNGRPLTSHLGAISTLVFHHIAVFLLLTHGCGGQSQMVGPPQPVLAMIGDDIILPCHLEPATSVVAETLEWSRVDLKPRFVHVRRDGVDLLLVNQNPSYVGRTSLFTDRLKHGDMSLKLSNVSLTDQGRYRCNIPALGTSAVQLIVGALSTPVVIVAEIDKATSRLVLQCESAGWYPEPEVVWLDGEGNLLSDGPTETVRGPDDLYTVSSRVTVEKRHSNSFTCRVHQKNINQTRETEIQILESVFMAPSCSAVRIVVVLLSVGFLLFSAGFFVLWKKRQSRNKMPQDTETKGAAGETEQLISHPSVEETEKLQKKEEDQKDLIYVILILEDQTKELERQRDQQKKQLDRLEKERGENLGKIDNLERGFAFNKDEKRHSLLKATQELDIKKTDYEKSLQIIGDKLEKTEDVMTRVREWKRKVDNQIEQMNKQLEETQIQEDTIQPQSDTEETNKNTLTSTEDPDTPNESPPQTGTTENTVTSQ